MIFETHAHYDDSRFDEDREALLLQIKEAGIGKIINVGASVDSNKMTIELAEKHADIYAAIGLHPTEIAQMKETFFKWMRKQAAWEKTIAIGEIGLDYYWEKEPQMQEKQRYWFKRQLALAKEVQLPVIIHSRDAAADTMQILQEVKDWGLKGVIHCYSYSKEMALEFIKMGYFLGIGGVVTFKNAKKLVETVEEVPLERILIETDCPYMAPEPFRGNRNSSLYLPYIIRKIAEIKGISEEEVERVTEENAKRFFQLVDNFV